jgi:hypothetical protein
VAFQFHDTCFFTSIVLMPGDEGTVPEARCLAEKVLVLIHGATPAGGATWGQIKARFESE